MKTLIRILLFLFLIGLIGLAVVYFTAPTGTWQGERECQREAVIDAPVTTVYNQVSNLRSWEKWSAWMEKDPEMKLAYGDKASGPGAWYSWVGEKSGSGKLTIKEVVPGKSISTLVEFEGMGDGHGSWTFEPDGAEKTKAVWMFSTDVGSNPIGQFFTKNFDSMLGPDLERGLELLGKSSVAQFELDKKGAALKRAAELRAEAEALEAQASE